MTNSSISANAPTGTKAKRRTVLGIRLRYWRLAIFSGVFYGALLIAINASKRPGKWEAQLGILLGAAVFGAMMAAMYAYFERKALARLDIDTDAAYDNNVFDANQRQVISLELGRDDALQLAEDALAEYGAVIEKRDQAAGRVEALTAQSWRSYGEKLSIVVSGSFPCEVTIRAETRETIFKMPSNYGRSWQHVHALAARMSTGAFPAAVARAGDRQGNTALLSVEEGCSTPPAVMEAGAWQRLMALVPLYSFMLLGSISPEKSVPVVCAFVLGVAFEAAAFIRYRRQVRDKLRTESQETAESLLNNLFAVLLVPNLMVNPARGWSDAGNITAIVVFGAFAVMTVNRLREKGRERIQRQAILVSREKSELQRQLAEAKLVALSAQIEPHFLFNTLASIQYLIRNDAGKATEMTGDLIRYLRLALPRMKQSTARLADELDLVRAYLGIMQIRMGARLQFTIDEPGENADREIPTMALITLVENAIKHGLEQKPDGGSISVGVTAAVDSLRLEVADTGGGFSTAASGTGIGLANIRERLETLYGSRASLSLEINQPSGVKAILTLPKEKK